MRYKNTNKEYLRNHRLWVRRGKPMHNEKWEEIEMQNEQICKDCPYYERVDGDMMCTATDTQWETDESIPCNNKEEA